MTGRVKRWFLDEDGRWVLHWQTIYSDPDPVELDPDYGPELILAMESLTDKQRFVIKCRYGMEGWPPLTVREIARLMGITHQGVSRLEQRAMVHLRERLPKTPIDV